MATKLSALIKSISSVFSGAEKVEEDNTAPLPVKHYTFLLKAEDEKMNISVIARDKSEAEQKLKRQYPNFEGDFLWEYTRHTAADFES